MSAHVSSGERSILFLALALLLTASACTERGEHFALVGTDQDAARMCRESGYRHMRIEADGTLSCFKYAKADTIDVDMTLAEHGAPGVSP